MNSDLIIIGAGAAGLAAAIFAGREAGGRLGIEVLDGAAKPGAKILVSGGGRCNVTNRAVTENDYNGGPRPIIRRVLRAFDERSTIKWMRELGVELKLEPTGKYFPVTDDAHTVLDALMNGARAAGARVIPHSRVESIEPEPGRELWCGPPACAAPHSTDKVPARRPGGFLLHIKNRAEPLRARRVILAAGGMALPKSGSDGAALDWLRKLGHTIIPTTPALAPLTLDPARPGGRELRDLAGVTFEGRLRLEDDRGRALAETTGSMVLTHFGLSGPAALDLSRHIARRRLDAPGEPCVITLGAAQFPNAAAADAWLLARATENPRRGATAIVAEIFPERLSKAMIVGWDQNSETAQHADQGDDSPLSQWPRERRRALAHRLAGASIPVNGDRGYTFAEATAGGVSLREIDPATMESRIVPGLHLCGEILDVDGRLGGFNFQWAWSSGYLAGKAAAKGLN